MILGIVFYGYIVAYISASMANEDAQRVRLKERLNGMKRFMEVRNWSLRVTCHSFERICEYPAN